MPSTAFFTAFSRGSPLEELLLIVSKKLKLLERESKCYIRDEQSQSQDQKQNFSFCQKHKDEFGGKEKIHSVMHKIVWPKNGIGFKGPPRGQSIFFFFL